MRLLIALVLLLVVAHFLCDACSETSCSEIEEDALLTAPELIKKNGYPVEIHHEETLDGYILEMHRIPYGRAENAGPAENKPVVFVQHGLLSSSADWVVAGPTTGLGYMLADLGYDVWLGNARGNTYSRKHTSLSSDSKKFWDFSWHEIGVYDLPAMIDYALETTGQSKMFYIGHSQGTTVFFVMCSELPEYNSKIRAQFSLSPVAYMNHMVSPIFRLIAIFQRPLSILLKCISMNELLPSNKFMAWFGQNVCGVSSKTQFICTNIIYVLCGFSVKQMNRERLAVIIAHMPAGSSFKQVWHYSQLTKLTIGKFRQYDYGLRNIQKYGRLTPPSYNLSAVTAPVALIYSKNDWLAAEQDVQRLYEELANPIEFFQVRDEHFNHLDFLWGRKVDEVYNHVFRLMTKY